MWKKKATATSLPLSKVAKIMISAVGVESVNPDIVALATKATEIFLMDFARRAYDQSSDEEFRSNVLEYDDIQKLVHSDERYDFLIDTTPKRIKFSEALKLAEDANKRKDAPTDPTGPDKEDKKVKLESSNAAPTKNKESKVEDRSEDEEQGDEAEKEEEEESREPDDEEGDEEEENEEDEDPEEEEEDEDQSQGEDEENKDH